MSPPDLEQILASDEKQYNTVFIIDLDKDLEAYGEKQVDLI